MHRTSIVILAATLIAAPSLFAQKHTVIALSHSDFTVYELDPQTGKILNQFKALNQPHEGATTRDGKTIFASIPQGPHVVVLDAATFKEKARIDSEYFTRPAPPRPAAGAPQSAPGGAPNAERAPNTSASPHGVALTPDGGKLYIGVENADVPGIVVYDLKAGRVSKKIDLLLRGGHYLQIQPSTGKLYYPHRNDHRVVVLDTKTDKVLKIVAVKGGPVGVDFAPNGEVWIHEDDDGSVTVIDSKTDEVVKVIQTPGQGAGRIAVSPDGRYAASTHGGTQDVAIIDTQKKEVIASVKLGRGPGFPLFSPDNSKLYVMNSGEGDVAIVDLKSMQVTSRYKVGVNPFGGGLRFPDGKTASQQ